MPRRSPRRRSLLILAFVILLAATGLAASQVLTSERFRSDDFIEYWAAGRLNLTGGNPYDPHALLPLQRSAGLEGDDPVMMWNPPWTLAVAMPFALLPYRVGRLLWLLLNLALLIGSVTYIWWYYRGPVKRRWVALVVLATYAPALWALRMGQISPLLLVGIVGFLHFEGRRRPFAAGALAALVAIKPHLLYLFWLALALWVVERRAWKVVLGVIASLAGGVMVALLVNRDVVGQYVAASLTYPPKDWATPTIGGGLRMLLGFDLFGLQFLPPLAGAVWFLWYWRGHRVPWQWPEQMPLLLVVSLATTPYGWEYDQVVSLLPILQVAIWASIVPRRWDSLVPVIAYLVLNGLALRQGLTYTNAFWLLWLAPAFLVWYLLARGALGPRPALASSAARVPHSEAQDAGGTSQ